MLTPHPTAFPGRSYVAAQRYAGANERIIVTDSLPIWAENLAVFDTETTGVDPATARIVSSCIALLGPHGEVTERYDWLLDPGIEIPAAAAHIHGISTEVARASGVKAAIGVAQIVDQLRSLEDRGLPLVVYNAPYDLTLLWAEANRYGVRWPDRLSPIIDPLVLDRQVDRYRKGKRTLEAVAQHYDVSLGAAHDAGEDAIAAGRVAQAIARRFIEPLPDDVHALHQAQIGWAANQAASFQEYMRRVRDPEFIADGAWPSRALPVP